MTRNIINEVPDDVKYEMLVETNYLPRDFEFPYNNEAKKRKFSSSHLSKFTWLRYSPSLDVVFCLPCILFGGDEHSKLITPGFSDWSNITKVCNSHCAPHKAKKSVHLHNQQRAKDFIAVFEGNQVGIMERLNAERHKVIENNRYIMLKIIKLIHRYLI